MIRVLFVCMGNICRSPMAEAVFQDMVNKAGLSNKIESDSAGTGGWHVGEPAHSDTLNLLKRNGIPYNGRSRQIDRRDLEKFDYVLMMDRDNLSFVQRYGSGASAEVGLFLRYAQEAGFVSTDEVPDPYYDGTFERVYSLVTRGSKALLEHIRTKHNI
jgi:protein-tyrosine phosphatase